MTESGGRQSDQPQGGGGERAGDVEHTQYLPPVGSSAQDGDDQSDWERATSDWRQPPVWQQRDGQSPASQPWREGEQWQPQAPYGQSGYPQPEYAPSSYAQPGYTQYGPPAYGAYPDAAAASAAPPVRQRSHLGLWVLLALAIIVAGLVAAAFIVRPTWLGFRTVLDSNAVASTIARQSNGQYRSVSCPANQRVKAGTTFQCTAANGSKITVRVTSDNGDYTWAPAG